MKTKRNPGNNELQKFHIKTFGCQMNVADSGIIASSLQKMGMSFTESKENADVIVLNTCTVRDDVEHNVMAFIGRLKLLKAKKPGLKIVVAGCAAERLGAGLKKKFPSIDLVSGAKDIDSFTEAFVKAFGVARINVKADSMVCLPSRDKESPVAAFVTIMRGCENFCSYCIVPHVRGPEVSRPAREILTQVESAVRAGFKEIILIGQNVNSYKGQGGLEFVSLLSQINEIEGVERIRFMTNHPKDLSDKLIEAIAGLDKVCGHIHLPLQSGSDKIFAAMNRKYNAKEYLELVKKLRARVPGISITTDILVGFPGETGEDFQNTMDIIERARFNSLFAYKYSPREGTASFAMKETVSEMEKESRLAAVRAAADRISKEINSKLKGSMQEVLVEKTAKGICTGRTGSNLKIFFEAPGNSNLAGSLVNVKVTGSKINTLAGQLES